MTKTLIPNTFQHPNLYIDHLAYLLTAEEQVVLQKAVREILGWQDERALKRRAHIALSVFVKGKFAKDGTQLCHGCGLGLQSVRAALSGLNKFGILIKTGRATQDGQLYTLQIDADKIDWEKLEERKTAKDEANRTKTEAATKASLERRGVTSDVRGNVGRNAGVTSDVMQGITWDVNKETQLETQLETQEEQPSEKPVESPPDRQSRLQEKFGTDPLDAMAKHAARQQRRDNGRPKGWDGASDAEFAVAQHVAGLWCAGILPSGTWGDRIERQCAGASELLRYHDGDLRACLMTIDRYHREYSDNGGGFTISGPQSLVNVLPAFMSKKEPPARVRPEPPPRID